MPPVLSAVLNYARPAVLDDYGRREYSGEMSENQKKRQLTDLELSECAALNAIYKAKKKDLGITQEMIAIDGLGAKTQSAASHYLTGKNALNLDAAIVFARYLQVRIDDFSPRLSREWTEKNMAALGFKAESPNADDQRNAPPGCPISTSGQLVLTDGINNVRETVQPYRVNKEYPLISWVAAGCWQESCDNFQPGSADEWLISDANAGPHGYWLEVKGASMLPKFTEGMRILIQPEGFDLVSGKFYIAKMLDSGETTFKQYVRDAGMEFLQPLNPAYPTLQITDNVRIIGRVVDTKMEPTLL